MQYDGSIRIGTGIDEKGFKAGSKELEAGARSLAKSVSDSLGEGAKIALQKQTDAFVKLNQQYAAQEQKVKEIAARLHDVQRQKVETAEFKELSKDLDKAKTSLDRLYDRRDAYVELGKKVPPKLDLDISDAERKIRLLEGDIKELKLTNKAYVPVDTSKVQQELAAAEQKQMQLYTALQTSADAISQKTSERIAKEDIAREKIAAEAAEEERLDKIRVNAVATNDQIIAKVERLRQLEQEIADLKAAERTEGYADYDNRIQEAARLRQDIREYNNELTKTPEKFEKMRASAKKAFDAVSSGAKKSDVSLSKGFKTILKYGFGIRSLYVLFNKIRSGITKGFKNLMGYSDSFANSVQSVKNSMGTLGNQIAAAFSPIVQMVIPWINSLIHALTKAIAQVSQFFAILGGKSTFTRAVAIQDKYNKALGGTAAAAKKAFGALARFDDLDVMQKQEDASGGGAETTLPKNMFEEVPVDKKALSWLDSIISRVKELKDIFAQGFWDGLGDWEYRWEDIKNSISSIKDNLVNIWTDPAVVSAADRWAQSVAYMLGSIVGSLASIGITIATNLLGGIAKYLEQNKGRIKEYLVSMFDIKAEINQMFSELFRSIAYVFEAFASEQGQQLTANIIGIFSSAFMGITEIASKLARDILNIFIQPFVDNKEEFRTALEGFIGVLSEVAGTIKNGIDQTFAKLNEVYDAHFKPFFDSVANGLSQLVGKFLSFWNGSIQPILDAWAAKFDEVWTAHIQPMINNFIDLLGQAADFLKEIWENILMPFIQWIIDNVLPVILPIIDGVVDGIMTAVGYIADSISGVIDIFSGLLTFLSGVFTGDWEKAWSGITKIMDGVKNTIKGIINAILGAVESMANGVVRAINKMIEALNSINFSIPDWVPGSLGGKSFGLNLSTIPEVSIPRLATGAVIRGGNPFMAILGDQPAGKTNIEAPLSTIEQAVENVMSRQGYNRESVPVNINLNYNGETFARLLISDILSELNRQGYNVKVLEG